MQSFIREVAIICYKKGWYHGKSFSSLRKVVLCVWRKRLFIIFTNEMQTLNQMEESADNPACDTSLIYNTDV